ncbi:odorant receptor 19a-like [Pectinophora gossypiella]|uniref:odorant receptor 19a-like n=1 Tax=Pectinophora gossypiella TaxID=13191 RepID=UPI00214E589B|nr:odorant receptor 19a-like [Pectinophora gossypiella]
MSPETKSSVISDMDQSERPRHYFGFHFLLMRVLGLGWWHHPEEGDNRNFPGLYLYYAITTGLVWVVGFVGLETIDPFIGERDLDQFMFSLSFVITHDLTMIKLYLFFFRNVDLQDVARILEVDLQSFYQNHEKTRATIRMTRILTGSFIFFGWVTIGNASLYGAVQDIKWRKEVALLNDSSSFPFRSLPQPIYIPWNYQQDTPYIITFALETVGLLWTGHIVMGIDTLIGAIILHMSSQFSVFQEAVLTAYDRTIRQLYERIPLDLEVNQIDSKDAKDLDKYEEIVKETYSEEEIGKALETILRDCFRQHQLLISCVQKFGRTYAYGFMTQLLSSMAAICVVMVQVSQDASSFKSVRLVTSLSFFVAMTLQLVLQCFTANELTIQAGRVANAVMESKWERMPVRLRRMLLLMMIRAQRPLVLSAAGFANMDNACFLAIMKAAYSYYAVLSQKQDSTH